MPTTTDDDSRDARRAAVALTRETIVASALELAQRRGAAALTLRRLGTELGVDATAFYRHFPDKDSLVLAVGDEVTGWILRRVTSRLGASDQWPDAVRILADVGWQASLEFPAILGLTFARTTGEKSERRIVELLLSWFEPLGLGRRQTVLVYRSFGDLILGMTGTNSLINALEPQLRDKDATAWSRIYAAQDPSAHPVTRRHTAELIEVSDREIFDFAVDTLIRGVQAMLADAGPRPTPRG